MLHTFILSYSFICHLRRHIVYTVINSYPLCIDYKQPVHADFCTPPSVAVNIQLLSAFQRGEVRCDKIQCPPTDCEHPYTPQGHCCPVCQGESLSLNSVIVIWMNHTLHMLPSHPVPDEPQSFSWGMITDTSIRCTVLEERMKSEWANYAAVKA